MMNPKALPLAASCFSLVAFAWQHGGAQCAVAHGPQFSVHYHHERICAALPAAPALVQRRARVALNNGLEGSSGQQAVSYYVDDSCNADADDLPDDVGGSLISAVVAAASPRCCDHAGQTCTSSVACPSLMTYAQAVSHCESEGRRLCTKDELLSNICCGTGGKCDSYATWTSTSQVAQTPGWYASRDLESCDTACQSHGLVCTAEQLQAHNGDVDSEAEVVALVESLVGSTCKKAGDRWGTATDVPNVNLDTLHCYVSSPSRDVSTFSCGKVAVQGKSRLCYCHHQAAIRSGAQDGRFLLQATFGPTRAGLAELKDRTYEQWIRRQMQLPVESHREYFRQRVNPRFQEGVPYSFRQRAACSKGSRWHRFAFTSADRGKRVSVSNGQIRIDGAVRTEIDQGFTKNGLPKPTACTDSPPDWFVKQGVACAEKRAEHMKKSCAQQGWLTARFCRQSCYNAGVGYEGDDCSGGWALMEGFSGYVCLVREELGGLVALSHMSNCADKKMAENPGIWFSNSSKAAWTDLAFVETDVKPGLIFLAEDRASCNLDGKMFLRRQGGLFYHYDARIELLENTCELQSEDGSEGGDVHLCGSPGEVRNFPVEGHQLPIHAAHTKDARPDTLYDNRYGSDVSDGPPLINNLGKSVVWLAKALQAQDQLRQRMAWALSQIFVVGSIGTNHDEWNELFVGYYDIFVRHAFGNFKDILREVTFSPLMGEYLTFINSRSFDASGSNPDENYAREIMQLFTIGLCKLTRGGLRQVDASRAELPTYDNEDIMSFARVFTGFVHPPARDNIELRNGRNLIDPMRLRAEDHDAFPKPDLDGGYLGDGLPLCSTMPALPFLLAGARFELRDNAEVDCSVVGGTSANTRYHPLDMPSQHRSRESSAGACQRRCASVGGCAHFSFWPDGGCHLQDGGAQPRYAQRAIAGPPSCADAVFKPASGSPLLRALCGGSEADCRLAPSRTLLATLACEGAECSLQSPGIFQVADRFYEFIPPPCTHLFLLDRVRTPTLVRVHDDGMVSAHTEAHDSNRFRPSWDEAAGVPPAGDYNATVDSVPVFTNVPSKEDALALLKTAVFEIPQGLRCDEPCAGDVKVCGESSPPGAGTVFEVDGHFLKNERSVVRVGNGSFRNPPVFVAPGPLRPHGRTLELAALAEVDSLLEYLFRHANTPVFIGRKLIQRFVTSNPSAAYLESVAAAFSTGSHGGVVYSGKYGDLGATIAAILLHQEARSSKSSTTGLLREPLVKLVHLMRSMEYKDVARQQVLMRRDLDDVIGQFPYRSPTVFNFFNAMYQPPSFADSMPGAPMGAASAALPEPEPEPEPEPLVAPEFDIFTPPLAIGFLNGVSSLLDHGVSACDAGFGRRIPGQQCHQGGLTFQPSDIAADTAVAELDVLLTGGRLSLGSREVVRAAYADGGLKGAQQAVVLTPEFQTLGAPEPNGTRVEEVSTVPHALNSYKAVVLLFLGGGADTYNLIVPLGCGLYDEYRSARTTMAIAQDELRPITASSEQPCNRFGVHPALPFLQELYEQQNQAAFVSSIGALVEPITHEAFRSGGGQRCLGLFSHSHGQTAAQTLKCQEQGARPRGAGGRMADALAAGGKTVASFSVSGTATWSGGFNTSMEIVNKGGPVRFKKYRLWGGAIEKLTKQQFGNLYCDEYSRALADHVKSSEALADILAQVRLETENTYQTRTGLARQLKQIALLIKAREQRGVERDLFFAKTGGFDTHGNQVNRLTQLFEGIDSALMDFVGELKRQSVFDSVVIVTHSDFGRTLTSNGAGTDHGWGGNHVVIGGAVKGGQIFNNFLDTYKPGSAYDAGRGRVIPQHPWESVMVPIAEWMGVSELDKVFPNIGNFNRTSHIIAKESLFAA